ncbi:hypothetical protein QA645_32200 [Bradyrhizobium sp. CIAT3101]|uniref:hypothetical protein n=1 Tax=Bradyrhizobium sp. CIAT3101 TaxID=439387 RepID=UPI0024B04F29|nr:hypothetical protein [Bradyrhizobium sp. CIAT3101]WFU79159.1 hypothetical protein QA645_32200 [Bradyrhizobium sp. CIAT3101]
MADSDAEREALRLLTAFKEIRSRGTRRAVIMLVEELAQKDDAQGENTTPPPPRAGGS